MSNHTRTDRMANTAIRITVLIRILIVLFPKSFPEARAEAEARIDFIEKFLAIRNEGDLAYAKMKVAGDNAYREDSERIKRVTLGLEPRRMPLARTIQETPPSTSAAIVAPVAGRRCESPECNRVLTKTGRSDKRFCGVAETGIKGYQKCRSIYNKQKNG